MMQSFEPVVVNSDRFLEVISEDSQELLRRYKFLVPAAREEIMRSLRASVQATVDLWAKHWGAQEANALSKMYMFHWSCELPFIDGELKQMDDAYLCAKQEELERTLERVRVSSDRTFTLWHEKQVGFMAYLVYRESKMSFLKAVRGEKNKVDKEFWASYRRPCIAPKPCS